MSKKGSKEPKKTLQKKDVKDILKRKPLFVVVALLIVGVGGYLVWANYFGHTTDSEVALTEDEREYQAQLEAAAKATTPEELNQRVSDKKLEIEGLESEQEKARTYYELAQIYYEKGDFDAFFETIKLAEQAAREAGDEELQGEIDDLKENANDEYESIKPYL